jgi:hypothetical protein
MNRRNNTQNNSNLISNSSRINKKSRRNIRRNLRQRRNISTRRNRRFGQALNRRRNRLARAQYASRNKNFQYRRRRRFALRFRTRMNLKLRKIFIGGLHKSITNSKLYNLFRREGKIVGWKVFYDRNGYSRGFGVIEFDRPRDAWKTIQKWNNTQYMGYKLRIEYKKNARRRINRNRRMNNANNITKGSYRNLNNGNRGFYSGKNNYQNGIRNVNSNTYGNRSRYYYYRN